MTAKPYVTRGSIDFSMEFNGIDCRGPRRYESITSDGLLLRTGGTDVSQARAVHERVAAGLGKSLTDEPTREIQ